LGDAAAYGDVQPVAIDEHGRCGNRGTQAIGETSENCWNRPSNKGKVRRMMAHCVRSCARTYFMTSA
jgi:hypothetical protein